MRKAIMFCLLAVMSMQMMGEVSQMLGDWTTVDDKTGQKRSVVHIYKATNGMYYGKIVKLLVGSPDAVCKACEGKDKDQPVVGLVIVRDMQEKDGELVGGKIMDPESGKTYYAKLSLKDGKLVLRGSLDKKGMFGRNQTWVK